MRISDWSSDVCSSDLDDRHGFLAHGPHMTPQLDANGRLRHLLTLECLPRATLVALLDRAQAFVDGQSGRSLAGHAVCTLVLARKRVASGTSVPVRVTLGGQSALNTTRQQHQYSTSAV